MKEDCLIGTGYNNCLDVGFHAVDLFHALRSEIVSLQESKDEELRPRMHPAINNLESFVETFLYFFEQGSNAEFVSLDKDLFMLFLDRLYDGEGTNGRPITLNEEIGGHSSVWTQTAQLQGCRSYITPWPSDFNLQGLKRDDANDG